MKAVREAIEFLDGVTLVPLTKGQFAFIDTIDAPEITKFNWTFLSAGYAYRWDRTVTPKKCIYMHRAINRTPDDKLTDHKDGNGLNNRRDNLRAATPGQNSMNSQLRTTTRSGFKGVSYFPQTNRWRAYYRLNNKFKHIGFFKTPEEAHEAYKKHASKTYGEFFKAA